MIRVKGEMPFTDVKKSDWFYDDVYYVYNEGLMKGNNTTGTLFAPQASLTRGMVVTMLYRLEGEPSTYSYDSFTDVASDAWYYKPVEWAAKEGIVKGYGKTFGPNNNITRQDLAVILYRYTTDFKDETGYAGSASLSKFNDANRVADYAEDALRWAVYEEILKGDNGNLKPTGNATRAEAAAMFHRFLED